MSNKIIPRLVDEKLIESIVQSTNKPTIGLQNVSLPSIPSFQNTEVKSFFQKYWIIILLLAIVCGLVFYHYYFKTEKQENFSDESKNKKQKKKKKVRIQENYNPSCPNCGNKDANCTTCNKYNGKMSEIEKPIEHLEYEQQIKHPSHNEHYEEPQYEPRHNEPQVEQMQPQQSYETTYHNQFYGQSITDDAQGFPRTDIETFNSGAMGNYVSF